MTGCLLCGAELPDEEEKIETTLIKGRARATVTYRGRRCGRCGAAIADPRRGHLGLIRTEAKAR